LDKIKQENNRDKKMEAFVKGIKSYKEVGLNFKKNLFDHIKENDIDINVKDVFVKAFKEIGDKE